MLCFMCLVRYLHPADHNPRRIRKLDEDFGKEFYFKDIIFPIKNRHICKIEKKKKKSIGISAFSYEKTSILRINRMLRRKTC